MGLIDLILILILLGFLGNGWRQGFVKALGEFIGAIISFLVARAFSGPLGNVFGFLFPHNPGIARLIAFIVIFLIVVKLIGWLFSFVVMILKIITSLPIISLVNRIFGGVLGFLTGLIFVGSAVYLVLSFRLDATLVHMLAGSPVARYTEQVFSSLLQFLI